MSQESTTPDLVELMQRGIEAGNRRDIDAVMSFFAPDACQDMTRTLGVAPQGRAAIRAFVEDWMAAYEEMEWTPDESLDLGNGVVFAAVSQRGRPVGTTGYVHQQEGWVVTWADGLIINSTIYTDIDEARATAERLAKERV
jgi:ketosteroid isomerase-like protein